MTFEPMTAHTTVGSYRSHIVEPQDLMFSQLDGANEHLCYRCNTPTVYDVVSGQGGSRARLMGSTLKSQKANNKRLDFLDFVNFFVCFNA